MKKSFVSNTLLLTLGGFICKIIGAGYKIPLANILGPEGMGIYQLSYPIYAFLLVFVSGGLPYALSISIAKARAKNQHQNIYSYFCFSFLYSFVLGALFFIFMIIFARFIANVQGNVFATSSYYVFAVTIFFSCLLPCFRGLFQGYEDYVPTFISQILEQIIKLVFGLLFTYLFVNKSIELGVCGAVVGILFGEVISFVYLLIRFIKSKKKMTFNSVVDKKIGFDFLKFSTIFLLIGIVTPFINFYQSFVAIPLLKVFGNDVSVATTLYGIQTGMVNSIIHFPTVLSTSVVTVLLPNLSYNFEIDKVKTKNILEKIFEYIFIFAFPCILGVYILSPMIISFVFPTLTHPLSQITYELLQISSLNILFIVIAQVSISALQSLKRQKQTFVHMLIFALVYMILLPVCILKYGIYGLVITQIFSYSILCVLNIILLKKCISFSINLKTVFVSFFASIIMGFFTWLLSYFIGKLSIFGAVIISVFISVFVYFLILFIFKIFNVSEFKKILIKNNQKI